MADTLTILLSCITITLSIGGILLVLRSQETEEESPKAPPPPKTEAIKVKRKPDTELAEPIVLIADEIAEPLGFDNPSIAELMAWEVKPQGHQFEIHYEGRELTVPLQDIQRIRLQTTDAGPQGDYFMHLDLKDTPKTLSFELGNPSARDLLVHLIASFKITMGPKGLLKNETEACEIELWSRASGSAMDGRKKANKTRPKKP